MMEKFQVVSEDRAASILRETARSFQMLVSYHNSTWCHNPEDLNLKLQKNEEKFQGWGKVVPLLNCNS